MGIFAWCKGNSFTPVFFVSLILSPLMGLIVAGATYANVGRMQKRKIKLGLAKRCPSCSQLIKPQAVICPRCDVNLS